MEKFIYFFKVSGVIRIRHILDLSRGSKIQHFADEGRFFPQTLWLETLEILHILAVHDDDITAVSEVIFSHLPRADPFIADLVLIQDAASPVMRRIADMPIPRAGGIDHDLILITGFFHFLTEDRFRHRRTTDIAKTYEQNLNHAYPLLFHFSKMKPSYMILGVREVINMKRQTLLFDMDDTLIHCNKYFNEAIEVFTEMLLERLKGCPLTAEEIMDKQLEIDLRYTEEEGFVSTHFRQSLIDTYEYFAAKFARPIEEDCVEELMRLGMSVYEKEIESYPHMNETLLQLKDEGHLLCLYTGGDVLIQQKKIEQMGLAEFFEDRIFIEQHKNSETLARIIEREGFERTSTWMIGNSVRTDIVPALENGLHAIHIPAEKEWAFNIIPVNVEPKGAYLSVRQLREIPAAIEEYWSTMHPR